MPQIPRGNISQVGIDVGQAAQVSPAIPEEREQRELLRAVEVATQSAVDMRNFRETTEADNLLFERLKEIKLAADADDNFDTKVYNDEIDSAISEAAGTITFAGARQKFLHIAQRQGITSKFDIASSFRDKEWKSTQASLELYRKDRVDEAGEMSQAQLQTEYGNYWIKLDDSVKRGILTKGEAEKDLGKFKDDMINARANYNTIINPEETLTELELGEDGEYADLSDVLRARYIKQAKGSVNQLEKKLKKDKNDLMVANRYDEIEAIAKGERVLDPDYIRNMTTADYDLGLAMTTAMAKDDEIILEKEGSESFLKATKDMLTSGTKEQISAFLVESLANPNISRDRLAILVFVARKKSESLEIGESRSFLEDLGRFFSGLGGVAGQLKDTAEALRKAQIRTLERSAQENADEKRTLAIAEEEVRKQRVRNKPELLMIGEEGMIRIDPQGNKARVYPDGRIEEIK